MVFSRYVAALSAAVALVGGSLTIGAAPAVAAPAAGAVIDTTPAMTVLDASKGERQTVFSADFTAASRGEDRFVGSELVLGNPSTRMFVGVTISCQGPTRFAGAMESGRNVWPKDGTIVIPVGMVITAKESGKHTCTTTVFMCDPGDCGSPTATGTVPVISKASGQRSYSLLAISGALPSWANDVLVPGPRDVLVERGKPLRVTDTFDVAGASGPVRLGAFLSITNCIEPDYPSVCGEASSTAIQGKARLSLALQVQQVPTQRGVTCATAKAKKSGGARGYTITWQQHHAAFAIEVPSFRLSTKAGCGTAVQVTITVTAKDGNDIAVEGGESRLATSLVYAVPAQ
jgi:hypothetical protein